MVVRDKFVRTAFDIAGDLTLLVVAQAIASAIDHSISHGVIARVHTAAAALGTVNVTGHLIIGAARARFAFDIAETGVVVVERALVAVIYVDFGVFNPIVGVVGKTLFVVIAALAKSTVTALLHIAATVPKIILFMDGAAAGVFVGEPGEEAGLNIVAVLGTDTIAKADHFRAVGPDHFHLVKQGVTVVITNFC